MANNKLPAEIHALQGSKGLNMGVLLPDKLKQRIPFAEWASRPELFNKQKFVEETAQYLYEVYGIGTEQDRHTLMMLADQMQTYIDARVQQDKHPLVIKINNGKTLAPNPFISVANEAMKNCIRIMNELGLTPRSRLSAGKIDDESPLMHFLKGPLAQ
jgi:P27 family predicted phage terminase small subunit